jgi:hypothetical protein
MEQADKWFEITRSLSTPAAMTLQLCDALDAVCVENEQLRELWEQAEVDTERKVTVELRVEIERLDKMRRYWRDRVLELQEQLLLKTGVLEEIAAYEEDCIHRRLSREALAS